MRPFRSVFVVLAALTVLSTSGLAARRAHAQVGPGVTLPGSAAAAVPADDGTAHPPAGPAMPTTRASRPLLIHVPGIAGERMFDRELVRGLQAAGVADQAVVFDWTGQDAGFVALVSAPRHRDQSARFARLLTKAFRADPLRPIIVTAHSGGTGIAVWALEQVPEDVRVSQLVLLASALSPTYDLTPALRRVSGRASSFHSGYDTVVLGAGTRTFGTIDGVKTESAGLLGFDAPSDAPGRAPLRQVAYDSAWMRLGYLGGHVGVLGQRFAEEVIAPLILTGELPTIADESAHGAKTTGEPSGDGESRGQGRTGGGFRGLAADGAGAKPATGVGR